MLARTPIFSAVAVLQLTRFKWQSLQGDGDARKGNTEPLKGVTGSFDAEGTHQIKELWELVGIGSRGK